MEQPSFLSAKFDCPVARQNCSRFAIAHDCETEHNQEKSQQTFAHLMISNVSAMFDYHMVDCRINKPFACSRCVICVSYLDVLRAQRIIGYFTHKLTSSENQITWTQPPKPHVPKPMYLEPRKSTQVCKTRTCARTCEEWPNGIASRRKP